MRKETADILALLDAYTLPNAEDAATKMADDFRKRRIEKRYHPRGGGSPIGRGLEQCGPLRAERHDFAEKSPGLGFGHWLSHRP